MYLGDAGHIPLFLISVWEGTKESPDYDFLFNLIKPRLKGNGGGVWKLFPQVDKNIAHARLSWREYFPLQRKKIFLS